MRKTGARIKHKIAIKPFCIKDTKYELDARAALLAIENKVCIEQHIIDLYVLADLCERLNLEQLKHIQTHCDSVKKLCEAIHEGTCDGLAAVSIKASTNILLEWFHKQDNLRIARITRAQAERLAA